MNFKMKNTARTVLLVWLEKVKSRDLWKASDTTHMQRYVWRCNPNFFSWLLGTPMEPESMSPFAGLRSINTLGNLDVD